MIPIYEFDCLDCGIRFEKMRKISEFADPAACPECNEVVNKVPSATNHSFAASIQGGPRPQNTGVHSIDYNFDRVVGRDAEAKWKDIEARQAHKRKVLRDNPGASGHDLSRTLDGEYKVMKPAERKVVETARQIHYKAQEVLGPTKSS